jgi:hypothetical protein
MMKYPVIGAALLAVLAIAPPGSTDAQPWLKDADGLKKAAAGLRQLAGRALPQSSAPGEWMPEYTKQSTWLRNAAGRCDALAKKLQAAGSNRALAPEEIKAGPNRAAEEVPNLRRALDKENGEFSFKSPEAKARQEEAKKFLQAFGQ